MSKLHKINSCYPLCVHIKDGMAECADMMHYSGYFKKSELLELQKAVANTLKYYRAEKITDETVEEMDATAFDLEMEQIRQSKAKPKPKKKDDLYLVLNVQRNTLKIGRSKNVHNRLQQLQISSSDKLELVDWIAGAGDYEKKAHERFADLRLEGEWFKFDQSIIDFFKNKEVWE